MVKKKKVNKIFVKKPKVGESYWFWFAGTITHGELQIKKVPNIQLVFSY